MSQELQKIQEFIQEHHVLSLATSVEDELSVCSLFYLYDAKSNSFVVASSEETTHIKHIKKNPKVAANILLETKKVGEIKGLQIRGDFQRLKNSRLQANYFKKFPYALAMMPKLWSLEVECFKLTDNALGFGKKIIWQRASL